MASEYDGSVKLAATFDTKYIKQSAQEMRKEMDKAFDSTSSMKMTKEVDNLRYSIKGVAREYDDVVKRMKELENTKVPTEEYNELMREFDKLAGKLGPLTEKQLEMQTAGKVNTKEWHKLGIEIGTVNAQMDTLQQEMTELRNTNTAFTSGTQTKEYQNLIKKADDLANKMRIVKQRTEEQAEAQQKAAAEQKKASEEAIAEQEKAAIAQGKSTKAYKALSTVVSTLWKDVKTLAGHLKQAALNLAKMVKNSILNGMKKLGNLTGVLNRNASSSEFSFKKLLRTLVAYGLGINTITSLFSKLRNYISAGLENLKEYEGGLNSVAVVMNEFQTSLQYLQNSLAAAFAPVITTILPILTRFIDRLATAVQSVGAFFSALKGASTYTKAIRTQYKSKDAQSAEKAELKAQNNANKQAAKDELKERKEAYKKEQSAFKEAQKARNKEIREAESTNKQIAKNNTKTKKNTDLKEQNTKAIMDNVNALTKQKGVLAGFDDLDVLGQEEDTDTSLMTPVEVPEELVNTLGEFDNTLRDIPEAVQAVQQSFEEAQIPNWVTDLANKIKEYIDLNDWEGLGLYLAEKFNSLLTAIDTWINEVFRPKGVEWATNIAELFNGLVAGIDWELLGKTLADGLNAVFDIVNTFLTTFDFLALGQGIGEAIKSWFDNVDWQLVGETFANSWNALIHTIQGIVTTPGIWTSIGTSIGTMLKSALETIDIDSLADTFIAIFNGVFEMLQAFLDTNPFEGFAEKIYTNLNKMIEEIDWEQTGATLSEFVTTLLGVFVDVAENTDWEGFGEGIGEFLGAIDWATILGQVGTIIWDVFSGIISGLFSTDAGKVFLGIVAGITGLKLAFSLGAAVLLPAIQELLIGKVAALLVGGLGGAAAEGAAAVGAGLATAEGAVAGSGLLAALSSLGSSIISAVGGFIAFLLSPEGLLIAAIAAALTGIIYLLTTHWDDVENGFYDFMGILEQIGRKIVEIVQVIWDDIIEGLTGMVNFGIDLIESFVNGIFAAINFLIYGLNSLAIDIPDWVPGIGGGTLNFNIPYLNDISIPRLAQGAVIPPNKQFLAMLGDQTSGTNIEAPLDTIVDAFREVMSDSQSQNVGSAEMVLDGQVFARLVTPYVISELHRQGYNVNVLEA